MKGTYKLIVAGIFVFLVSLADAQDFYAATRTQWLQTAQQLKPMLTKTVVKPMGIVTLEKDAGSFQGWKTSAVTTIDSLYSGSFKKRSGTVIDFGQHLTGNFSLSVRALRGTPDAPLRFRLTFGEVPAELATPFDPYPGSLSRAWLQDEVITVMELPIRISLERRVAFRYVKIELLGSSPYFDFKLDDMSFEATSSATTVPDNLKTGTDPLVGKIDAIGLKTLQECMQTVYEDGPKRDRRLWIGDLYLESLANAYSFKNQELTKRCFYLLAGLSREDGMLNSNVFETPEPHPQTGAPFLFDYSLLYNVALKEYVSLSGDKATAMDLWPLVKKQLDGPATFMTADGIFDYQAAQKAHWWLFVDWKDGLDREVAIQGIIIYAYRQTLELARLLGKEQELSHLPSLIKKMTDASRRKFLNKKSGLFESGDAKQVSVASQAWMILSDVATTTEGQKAISAVCQDKEAIGVGAPYLYHYFVEAMIHCGLKEEARSAVVTYWGGMVKKGADTFWEVYDPTNEFLSPYNFYPINSYCHAWSCTPVYFIRKYPDIFQR